MAISFDRIFVNQGLGYQTNTDIFVDPIGGYYWVSFSAGVNAGQVLKVNLVRKPAGSSKTQILVDLNRTAKNHEDVATLSRSILIALEKGDELYLTAESGTGFYSDNENIASFMGFLVQPNKDWD
jgi:hypothetical protein